MTKTRKKSEEIRRFIIDNTERFPHNIVAKTSESFSISRQAAHRHVQRLVKDGFVEFEGATRDRKYTLLPIAEHSMALPLTDQEEDKIWRIHFHPLIEKVSSNVRAICQYGFTEIVNNAIDHSEGTKIALSVRYTPASIEIQILDDGIGIFNKIQRGLNLDDPLHAILELSKGKLTTDPQHHTGEGIFFTSRMFDAFNIHSGKLHFFHEGANGKTESDVDWLLEDDKELLQGTYVRLQISVHSARTTQQVFDRYTTADDHRFSRTRVPVFLARYGDENLVSRSQAKRLLARFDRFQEIVLDFNGVDTIGQAFADEIFRVFRSEHPRINLVPVNTNKQVTRMILRVTHEA